MLYQTTLRKPIFCSGIGLHSGLNTRMNIRPAAPDTGIVFIRQDLGRKSGFALISTM